MPSYKNTAEEWNNLPSPCTVCNNLLTDHDEIQKGVHIDCKEREFYGDLSMDSGAGESDYPVSLTFTSSKFIVTAFGHDREHCEDRLQCILKGRYKDHKGDREFESK